VTKAEIIRAAIEANPGLKPSTLAKKIMADNPGVKVSNSEVSNYKTGARTKQKPLQAAPAARPAVPTVSLSDRIALLKEIAQQLGGKDEAKRILDLLG
jgi:hypothetical protein